MTDQPAPSSSATAATPIIEGRNLVKRFGGAVAVDGVDIVGPPRGHPRRGR
jgi:hypothetical protein